MPNLSVLKQELLTDPLARGYAGMTAVQKTALLNTKNRTRERATLAGTEVYEAIVASEFTALSATLQQEVWNLIHMGTLYVATGKRARARFIAIFGAGSATITALGALVNESISRAEELGLGVVAEGHIAEALAFGG